MFLGSIECNSCNLVEKSNPSIIYNDIHRARNFVPSYKSAENLSQNVSFFSLSTRITYYGTKKHIWAIKRVGMKIKLTLRVFPKENHPYIYIYIVRTTNFPDIVIWQSTEKRLRRENIRNFERDKTDHGDKSTSSRTHEHRFLASKCCRAAGAFR